MTPIDSLLAAKKALAASEAAELAKDYSGALNFAADAMDAIFDWRMALARQIRQQRRDKGIADCTEVMAAQYRADNRG